MISIVITSYKEPETIGRAIEAFLNQKIKVEYEIIGVAPDKETSDVIKSYSKKHKEVKYLKDPGKGKMYALHMVFEKVKGDILILTDGDVFVGENSIEEILGTFKNKEVGCVGGHPVPVNSRKSMYGYWSHLLCYGANLARIKRSKKGKYFTCSGYLFAFRNGILKEFPRDVPEDAYIPFFFMKRGYKIKYLSDARVYVKYPENFKDWLEQKKRISKAYENLKKVTIDGEYVPKMKSFTKELLEGPGIALRYSKNLREFVWTFLLIFARLYMWGLTFLEMKKGKKHTDGWKVVESTK